MSDIQPPEQPETPSPETPSPDKTPPGPTPLYRRAGVLIGVGAVALALVAGGVGYGLSEAFSSDSHPQADHRHHARPWDEHGRRDHGAMRGDHPRAMRNGVVGTIAAQHADTWTITRRDGASTTVTITPSTKFGAEEDPVDRAQFRVGAVVAVRGDRAGDAVTAVRIVQLDKPGQGHPS